MADHFLGALKEIERRSRDNTLIFSDVLSERLDGIAESMISTKLSDNDYMKLLELYYQKYHKQEKKKAMMYCILRIQQMAECKKMKKFNKNIKNTLKLISRHIFMDTSRFCITMDTIKVAFSSQFKSCSKRSSNSFEGCINEIVYSLRMPTIIFSHTYSSSLVVISNPIEIICLTKFLTAINSEDPGFKL